MAGSTGDDVDYGILQTRQSRTETQIEALLGRTANGDRRALADINIPGQAPSPVRLYMCC
jgi:hypothetical protein